MVTFSKVSTGVAIGYGVSGLALESDNTRPKVSGQSAVPSEGVENNTKDENQNVTIKSAISETESNVGNQSVQSSIVPQGEDVRFVMSQTSCSCEYAINALMSNNNDPSEATKFVKLMEEVNSDQHSKSSDDKSCLSGASRAQFTDFSSSAASSVSTTSSKSTLFQDSSSQIENAGGDKKLIVEDDNALQLLLAASQGEANVVKMILKNPDVDINKGDKDDGTALLVASAQGHDQVVDVLLSHENIEVNKSVEQGITALTCAAQMGNHLVVQKLLSHERINVNQSDTGGHTALMLAAGEGHDQVVQELLSHKNVNVHAKDSQGRTASDIAQEYGYTYVADVLNSFILQKDRKMPEDIEDQTCDNPFTKLIESNDKNLVKIAFDTMDKIVTKIVQNPNELKYKRINRENKVICKKILDLSGGWEAIVGIGFQRDGKMLMNTISISSLSSIRDDIRRYSALAESAIDGPDLVEKFRASVATEEKID